MKKVEINILPLKNFRTKHNMSIAQFCKFCNISVCSYRRLINGESVRISIVCKVCLATKISCRDLFGV